MDQDSAHIVDASKVPMLKLGEYELLRLRMEQYIQMIDYSLWEVIENGNPAPKTKLVKGVETIIALTTAKEKALRRLLRREVLDHTFDRLQKFISQFEIHGESISQEDVNQKFLRSLSPEWNTHIIMWRNKPEIDTLSLDDLFNNLKIYESEVADGYANNEGKEILEEDWKKFSVNVKSNRENTRRVVPVETITSNALISCDVLGYECSDQAGEGPTNFALMAYISTSSNSKVSTDSNCLECVKARLLVYKKNKSVYEEDIKIVDKCKTGLGYNAVPPPYTRNFMPPTPDLSFSSQEEFVNEPIVSEPTVKKPIAETSEVKASADKPKVVKKNNGAQIIKDWVSDSEEDDVHHAKIEKKSVKPSFAKSKEQVKSPHKTNVKQGIKAMGRKWLRIVKFPKAMIPLLEEFSDVFPDELPDGLPHLHDIQHHIDLEPGS
ncbi:hypothetical protein Tco_1038174 [Tanacetum coccineum]